jgi:ribosome-binding factor A
MSKRIQRVNQLIKKELGQIILRGIEFPKDVLVTITRVETSVDLNQTQIFISCLPETQSKNILEILNRQIYNIQQKLNKRLKMKFIPRIEFREERKTREAGQVEEILEELKNKEK